MCWYNMANNFVLMTLFLAPQIRRNMKIKNLMVVGWYHSHPYCPPDPSIRDIDCQMSYQLKMRGSGSMYLPCIGFILCKLKFIYIYIFFTKLITTCVWYKYLNTVLPILEYLTLRSMSVNNHLVAQPMGIREHRQIYVQKSENTKQTG